jgi:magnesium transporter
MIRSFVFSQGKLLSQDAAPDFLKVVLVDEGTQIWVDLDQPTPEETKDILEALFGFHPLSIEDCVAVSERPKVEEYEGYLFMVMHAVDFSTSAHAFKTTELNMFIGRNYLVTYHESPLRSVTSTIDRVLKHSAAVARAPDRLTYTILDFLLDNYEPALEDLSGAFDDLEHQVVTTPDIDTFNHILDLKAQVQRLRQIITPQREVISRLARGEFKLVRAHMLPYYRDLLDRIVRITDMAEDFRDSLNSTLQVYLNMQQLQANRVMKVLTVLATLSIPFVAVTSFYGMNFRHIPELDVKNAHLFVFVLTALFTALIFWLLKRKRWL